MAGESGFRYPLGSNLSCIMKSQPSDFEKAILAREDDLSGMLAEVSAIIKDRLSGHHLVQWVNILHSEYLSLASLFPQSRPRALFSAFRVAEPPSGPNDDGGSW